MSDRTAVLRTSIAQIENLVENKDRLLEHKKMLAEELLHRVRNNLQLIFGMLTRQRDSDAAGQRGVRARHCEYFPNLCAAHRHRIQWGSLAIFRMRCG